MEGREYPLPKPEFQPVSSAWGDEPLLDKRGLPDIMEENKKEPILSLAILKFRPDSPYIYMQLNISYPAWEKKCILPVSSPRKKEWARRVGSI
jgi:hypothetical protein